MTHSITTLCHYSDCHYAECRILFIVMLNVDMLCVIMLNVFKLSVIVLSVVAPDTAWSKIFGRAGDRTRNLLFFHLFSPALPLSYSDFQRNIFLIGLNVSVRYNALWSVIEKMENCFWKVNANAKIWRWAFVCVCERETETETETERECVCECVFDHSLPVFPSKDSLLGVKDCLRMQIFQRCCCQKYNDHWQCKLCLVTSNR